MLPAPFCLSLAVIWMTLNSRRQPATFANVIGILLPLLKRYQIERDLFQTCAVRLSASSLHANGRDAALRHGDTR